MVTPASYGIPTSHSLEALPAGLAPAEPQAASSNSMMSVNKLGPKRMWSPIRYNGM